MRWRLGLDIGTNSIGWAAMKLPTAEPGVKLDYGGSTSPVGLLASGVRIFPDGRNPKDGQSLAVARREPRQMRRMRDRKLLRGKNFMAALIAHGLMPPDEAGRKALEILDPWTIRLRGLDQPVGLYELGRALYHLLQRRGFKSNRKTDSGDNEGGKIKEASARLQQEMLQAGSRTLAEYLAGPLDRNGNREHGRIVRARLYGTGAKAAYDFYPTRDLIEAEFEALWSAQAGHHPDTLTESAHDSLHTIFFRQRGLKAQPIGKCTLNPSLPRGYQAMPTMQRVRIYQEVNHLKVRSAGLAARNLTLEERDQVVALLLRYPKRDFDQIRKTLKLNPSDRFNLEGENRKHLDGDKTAERLAAAKVWGKEWRDLPLADQDRVVERLLDEEDEEHLVAWLQTEFRTSATAANAAANASLPPGVGNLALETAARLLPELAGQVITYDRAVIAAGYKSHSDLERRTEGKHRLPYYGVALERHVVTGESTASDIQEKQFGKIANPTVHVALNQIRRVVNALIDRFGSPDQVVVEIARDLPLSAKAKSEENKKNKQNREANEIRRATLKEHSQHDSYDNRLRLRLWEESNPDDPLNRCCPYTGEQIGIKRLFSDDIEIDHILPFSRTLDDGVGNKVLCVRQANRDKTNKSPYEAFSHSPGNYVWDDIAHRATDLPNNKAWRFGPDAMERFAEESDFLARHLNETKYISRLARTYLQHTGADVWVTPGRLTKELRWVWRLDSLLAGHNADGEIDTSSMHEKNRNDHRHHALDAIVVALTDRSLIQRVATASARAIALQDTRLLAELPDPWDGFRDMVRDSLNHIIVSYKPNHGVQAALHNDTAYGFVKDADGQPTGEVVRRVPLGAIKSWKNLEQIRDASLRRKLQDATKGVPDKAFPAALVAAGEAMTPPIRRIRITEVLSVIPITDSKGNAYKGYKGDGNYCYDIYAKENGTWTGEVISSFDANQPDFDPKSRFSRNGSPLIMRIRKNDMLEIDDDAAGRMIVRVCQITPGKCIVAPHTMAGNLRERDRDNSDPFNYIVAAPSALKKKNAIMLTVDPSGLVHRWRSD